MTGRSPAWADDSGSVDEVGAERTESRARAATESMTREPSTPTPENPGYDFCPPRRTRSLPGRRPTSSRRFPGAPSNGRASFLRSQEKQCLEKVAALKRQLTRTRMGRLPGDVLVGGDAFAPNWPYPDPGGVANYRHHRAAFAKLLIDRVIHCRLNATDPRRWVA